MDEDDDPKSIEDEEETVLCHRHKRLCVLQVRRCSSSIPESVCFKCYQSMRLLDAGRRYKENNLKAKVINENAKNMFVNDNRKGDESKNGVLTTNVPINLKQINTIREEIQFSDYLRVSSMVLISKDMLVVQYQIMIDVFDLNARKRIITQVNSLACQNIIKLARLGNSPYQIAIIQGRSTLIYDWRSNKIIRRIQKQIVNFKHFRGQLFVQVLTLQSGFDAIAIYHMSKQKYLTLFSHRRIGINSIDTSFNGTLIACGGDEMIVFLYSPLGHLIAQIPADNWISHVFFQPRTNNILFQTQDHAIHYYRNTDHPTLSVTKNMQFLDLSLINHPFNLLFCKNLNKIHCLKSYVLFDFVNNTLSPILFDQIPKPNEFIGIIRLKQKFIFIGLRNIIFI